MIKAMYSAVTGLRSHQTYLDVIGNNIANVNTAGFKSSRVVFTDIYYQTMKQSSAPTATQGGINPSQIGYGANVASIDNINSPSAFQQTFRSMDFYISGEGFFVVDDSSGSLNYSRVGNLKIDVDGNLIDGNGGFICGGNTVPFTPGATPPDAIKITNPENYTEFSISSDGILSAIDTTSATFDIVELAQLSLAYFQNADGLLQTGNMYYKETTASGAAEYDIPATINTGALISGGLELSNVDLSKEFTDMIIAQRGFQANSRVITTSDSVLEELVNLKR